jgi:hypothetical protein
MASGTELRLASEALLALVCLATGCTDGQADAEPSAPPETSSALVPASSAPIEDPCEQTTSLGDHICCGRPDELPNISCVDLSDGGTIYGGYQSCRAQGQIYDMRFVGGICCEPLSRLQLLKPQAGASYDGLPPGCGIESLAAAVCSACGDGLCQDVENWCNCPTDCPTHKDAG